MPGFTVVNLKDVEPMTGPPGAPPELMQHLEGRFARKHMDSAELGVSYFRYAPGFRSPMAHSHREQEEAYVVVEGSGQAKLDADVVDLRQWDVLRVAPEVVRAFAAGSNGLTLLAIGGTKPEGGDGVRAPEGWGWD